MQWVAGIRPYSSGPKIKKVVCNIHRDMHPVFPVTLCVDTPITYVSRAYYFCGGIYPPWSAEWRNDNIDPSIPGVRVLGRCVDFVDRRMQESDEPLNVFFSKPDSTLDTGSVLCERETPKSASPSHLAHLVSLWRHGNNVCVPSLYL